MPQIWFENAYLQFGDIPLLDNASFMIEKNDRIAVVGRNGAGKSSLLKLIQGELTLDAGNIKQEAGLKIATMQQHVPQDLCGSVQDFLLQASQHEWETYQIDRVLSQLQLSSTAYLQDLSGGQIRRALLAKALLNEPDILLLDEPTNHLDIESIEWLESFLKTYRKTIIFVTHDRSFMENVATRLFEIDLGKATCWDGSYETFLAYKETALAAEESAQALFDKRLAQEEIWIRQGVKARRTRNEGRVRALKKMRSERAARLKRQGNINIQQQVVDRNAKIAFEIDNISIDFAGKTLIKNFSTTITAGEKIGIIGRNGCGKTSFLNVLLGSAKPSSGQVKCATQLQIAYFDQHRMQLELDKSAIENVAGGAEQVTINGKSKHIISYLQDFLFTPTKARSHVKQFSGGERCRLLLAKLFTKPFNVLVLDEPSNDLDMQTLDLLEEYLSEYKGTLFLVSHDRTLLNNVINKSFVFEDNEHLTVYAGNYDDYLLQRPNKKNAAITNKKTKDKPKNKQSSNKLTYKDQLALKNLPLQIEALEERIATLQNEMSQAEFYQQEPQQISHKQKELNELTQTLTQFYEDWERLESKKQNNYS